MFAPVYSIVSSCLAFLICLPSYRYCLLSHCHSSYPAVSYHRLHHGEAADGGRSSSHITITRIAIATNCISYNHSSYPIASYHCPHHGEAADGARVEPLDRRRRLHLRFHTDTDSDTDTHARTHTHIHARTHTHQGRASTTAPSSHLL